MGVRSLARPVLSLAHYFDCYVACEQQTPYAGCFVSLHDRFTDIMWQNPVKTSHRRHQSIRLPNFLFVSCALQKNVFVFDCAIDFPWHIHGEATITFKVDRLQIILVAIYIYVSQLFISKMPKMHATSVPVLFYRLHRFFYLLICMFRMSVSLFLRF